MVTFMVRRAFTDGLLKSRMEAGGLPASLELKHSHNNRIERIVYECSVELALAMLRAGADLEFIEWSPEILEYRKLNMP